MSNTSSVICGPLPVFTVNGCYYYSYYHWTTQFTRYHSNHAAINNTNNPFHTIDFTNSYTSVLPSPYYCMPWSVPITSNLITSANDPAIITTAGRDLGSLAIQESPHPSYEHSAISENKWLNYIRRAMFPVDTSDAYFIEPFVVEDYVLGITATTSYSSFNMIGVPFNTKTGTNGWPDISRDGTGVREMVQKCHKVCQKFQNYIYCDGRPMGDTIYMSQIHPRRLTDFIVRTCTDVPVIITSDQNNLYGRHKFLAYMTCMVFEEPGESAPQCFYEGCLRRVVSVYYGPPCRFRSGVDKLCSVHCKSVKPHYQRLYNPILTSIDVDTTQILVYVNRIDWRTGCTEANLIGRIPHNIEDFTPYDMPRADRLVELHRRVTDHAHECGDNDDQSVVIRSIRCTLKHLTNGLMESQIFFAQPLF